MLTLLCALCLVATAGCGLVSVLTRNYSQVDRLWSILPPVYVGLNAWHAGFADQRLDLMAGLVLLWGLRLTGNFARKGGYRPGNEDYRWPVLRRRLGPLRFQLFNATFIAPFQNLLLLLLAAPAYVVLQHRGPPLHWIDALATAGFLLFLAGETLADEQQWAFHAAKHARQRDGQAPGPPFLTSGLFRYSRHPNFFCEQALWWCFSLFAVAAGGRWGPALAGPALLTLLFQGSTAFTEQISAAKYPAYADYQRRTSRLWPWPPRN